MKTFRFLLFYLAIWSCPPSASRGAEDSEITLLPSDGEIARDESFTVSFPAPMVAPDAINQADLPPPLILEPKVAFQFLWKSETEGELTLSGPIRPGTKYRVATAAALKDARGAAVARHFWDFESAPFQITASDDERQSLSEKPRFTLTANYAVALSDAAAHIYFQDRDSHERLPVDIIVGNDQSAERESEFTVSPRTPLPMGRTFDVVVNGIRDADGQQPLNYLHVFPAGTTAPLEVQWVGAFNHPLEKPIIRAKFSESIEPDSVTPDAITLTPAVADVKFHAEADEIVAEGSFDFAQRYIVHIAPGGVKGIRGHGLTAESKWGATFHPKESAIIFPGPEIYQRSARGLKFALLQINTGPLTWKLSQVPAPRLSAAAKIVDGGRDGFDFEVVGKGTFDASGGDAETLRNLEWKPEHPLSGPYLLEVSGQGDDDEIVANRALLFFSEYMLTEKRTGSRVLVRVARMDDGSGVPDVPVRMVSQENFELEKATTDANGIATFEVQSKLLAAHLFIAETPSGPVLQQVDGSQLSSASSRSVSKVELRALVVTDRNLYRPAQTVKVHGMVRVEKSGTLGFAENRLVSWTITAGGDAAIASGTAPLSATGAWDAEWEIPATQATGIYQIRCEADGLKMGQGTEFRVEEYRVPLFSVVAEKVDDPTAMARVKVSSAYFHGAPNAGARVHWKALWITQEGGDEDFVRSDEHSENHPTGDFEKQVEGDAALDRDGTVSLHSEPPFADAKKRGRCSVIWTVDVTSAEGQTLSGGVQGLVQFAPALAGIRAMQKPGDPKILEVKVDAVDVDDAAVEGIPVRVAVFHVTTKTVKEKLGPNVFRYRNVDEYSKVGEREVASPATMEFPALATGDYVVAATGPADIPVSTQAYISGEERAELPVESETKIAVTLPEPARPYAPGETVPISVQAPFGGVAWVSVETGEILDTLFVPLVGNAGRIDLPIKKEYAPNVFVSVYLVQPGGESKLPRERIGEVMIEVTRPDRELSVTTKLAVDTVRPGAPVRGEIAVTSEDRPVAGADFVVFAVDDAVLQLGDWKMPDWRAAFYPLRDHGVTTYSALAKFTETFPSLQQKGFVLGDGGDEVGNVNLVRKEFRTLAFWKSDAITDANGKITFEFTAPDNLTSYRVVAIGQTAQHQFGSGDATFAVSKPLLCDPALPRFLRVGDEVQLRGVARQKFADSATIAVKCSVDEGLELIDPAPLTRTAARDIPAVFSFAARVRDVAAAKVHFDVTSGNEADSVELTLPVHPPTVLRHESIAVAVGERSFAVEEVAPPAWKGARGTFDVTLSTSPWLPKLMGLPQILEYPHGCFEQLGSRFLAYALMADLLRHLPEAEGREAHYREMIASGLKRFDEAMLEDGMLPYWPESKEPNAFVTVLAAWAAREAAAVGIEAPAELRKKLDITLEGIVQKRISADSLTRALALMISAKAGSAEQANVAEEMYLKRDRFSDETRALLALALQQIGALPREKAQLLAEIAKPIKERAFDPQTFASTTRAEALATLALARISPASSQMIQRRDRLLKIMDSSADFSTQENLWLLLAFKAMHDAGEAPPLETEALNPKPALISKSGASVAWTRNDLAALAKFQWHDLPANPLTALISAEFRRPEVVTERGDRGFRVERVLLDLTDRTRAGTAEKPFKLGDEILITYRLLTRKLHYYVALEDLLPAGLETVNPNLPMIAKFHDLPAEPDGHTLDLSHSELRDQSTCLYFNRVEPGTGTYSVMARATCAGAFRWPAVQVTPMYDSRFSGLSASSSCVVSE